MTSEHDNTLDQADTEGQSDPYFGVCPECGRNNGFLNVGRGHWMVCHAHRVRWCLGSNWFSCWREDTEEEWKENWRRIGDYREVPYVPVERDDGSDRVNHDEVAEDEATDRRQVDDDDELPALPAEMASPVPPALFDVGQIYLTPGARESVSMEELVVVLNRHMRGDWGDVGEEDRRENDLSVKEGYRLLSSYTTDDGTRFWLITEADRSSTTVLLPDEY